MTHNIEAYSSASDEVMTNRYGREVNFKDGSKLKLEVRFSLMLVLGLG